VEAAPVAELDRERERGQGGDAAQAGKPGNDVAKRRLGGELDDRLVERVASRLGLRDDRVAFLEGERERSCCEALLREPAVVRERPGAAVIHTAVTQQQLREPVAGAH